MYRKEKEQECWIASGWISESTEGLVGLVFLPGESQGRRPGAIYEVHRDGARD